MKTAKMICKNGVDKDIIIGDIKKRVDLIKIQQENLGREHSDLNIIISSIGSCVEGLDNRVGTIDKTNNILITVNGFLVGCGFGVILLKLLNML